MAYIRVNVLVTNDSNEYERMTVVKEFDLKSSVFTVNATKNSYEIENNIRKLVNVKKTGDDNCIFERIVDSIYIDNVKVYDYRDYTFEYDKKNGFKIDYKNELRIPKL